MLMATTVSFSRRLTAAKQIAADALEPVIQERTGLQDIAVRADQNVRWDADGYTKFLISGKCSAVALIEKPFSIRPQVLCQLFEIKHRRAIR